MINYHIIQNEDFYADKLLNLFRAIFKDRYFLGTACKNNSCLDFRLCYGTDFSNECFTTRPFYWGDCDCGAEKIGEHCIDTCATELPNFEHRRSGVKVRWYKYIMRSGEINKEISCEEFDKIIKNCIDSLR